MFTKSVIMFRNLVNKLHSKVEQSYTPDPDTTSRRYVDRFEMISIISQFYSEDSAMSVANVYRNILEKTERDHAEGRIDRETYVSQKRQIEIEIAKLCK